MVCRGLAASGFKWDVQRATGNPLVADSKVIAALAPTGEEFLIFFYKAVQTPSSENHEFFTVDFGVKKFSNVCHITQFDVIAQAHEAILRQLAAERAARSLETHMRQEIQDPFHCESTPTVHLEVSLVSVKQMQSELSPQPVTKPNIFQDCEMQEAKTPTHSSEMMVDMTGGKEVTGDEVRNAKSHGDQPKPFMTSNETIETKDTLNSFEKAANML